MWMFIIGFVSGIVALVGYYLIQCGLACNWEWQGGAGISWDEDDERLDQEIQKAAAEREKIFQNDLDELVIKAKEEGISKKDLILETVRLHDKSRGYC